MTVLLALDTSTPRGALALGRVGEAPLATDDVPQGRGRQASASLLDRLRALLEQASITPGDLDVLACGVGPGMFTGVRVAIATAKGIAMGLGIDVVPVSTLDAVACSLPESAESEGAPQRRLALLDARRGEVYAASCVLDGPDLTSELEPQCAPLSEVLDQLDEPHAAIGSGVDPEAGLTHPSIALARSIAGPSPQGLWHAAVATFRREGPSPAASLSAVYLRKSYAELGLNPPKRPFVKSPFV